MYIFYVQTFFMMKFFDHKNIIHTNEIINLKNKEKKLFTFPSFFLKEENIIFIKKWIFC
jgi:hypothetical protein